VRPHELYGDIPLIQKQYKGSDGRQYELMEYDPDYSPPLPPGAVRGDVRRQEFCPACHVPRYFYLDQDKACVQCGNDFIFSAKEQKYWYETLKFNFNSIAIRCPRCRKARRTESGLRAQIAAAREALQSSPEDPTHLLALAESITRYHQLTGEGDLNAAISAARKAHKVWPGASEPLFWEAVCHQEAHRRDKAAKLFREFVGVRPQGRRYRLMVTEAEKSLRAGGEHEKR
jgi:hypothetical protein